MIMMMKSDDFDGDGDGGFDDVGRDGAGRFG